MSEPTQGPWVANGDQVEVPDEHNAGYRICDVFGPDYRANARLIAAAPELLEALKYIAKTWPDDFAARHARAAIAKAEGRS